jgi:DNA-binding transcriptional LysR family regulator
VIPDARFELRQLRTFAAVAERRSFTGAADHLHIAQQAVSQQIRALEQSLGVTLLERSSRRVTLTPEGSVFLADCSRVLSAADRASRRVRAAARGEVGSLRLAYTLTTVWDTIPVLVTRLGRLYPQVKVEAREVFGGDIEELLTSGQYDLALAPMTSYAHDLQQRTVRGERLRVALADGHAMANSDRIELSALRDEQFEIWPREMAPGFYDAVLGVCRGAGFEPRLDDRAGGNTVWGNIARGRGVALINGSLIEQLPRGIKLVNLADPQPKLLIDAVWHGPDILPTVKRALETAALMASERNWL